MTEPMLPSVALRKARELITPEGAWTQRASARSESGESISVLAADAVCWCSSGAIRRISGGWNELFFDTLDLLRSVVGRVPLWNDNLSRTHAEVLDAFRRAEQLAIAEGR